MTKTLKTVSVSYHSNITFIVTSFLGIDFRHPRDAVFEREAKVGIVSSPRRPRAEREAARVAKRKREVDAEGFPDMRDRARERGCHRTMPPKRCISSRFNVSKRNKTTSHLCPILL